MLFNYITRSIKHLITLLIILNLRSKSRRPVPTTSYRQRSQTFVICTNLTKVTKTVAATVSQGTVREINLIFIRIRKAICTRNDEVYTINRCRETFRHLQLSTCHQINREIFWQLNFVVCVHTSSKQLATTCRSRNCAQT